MLLDGASGIMLVLGISVVLNIVVFMYFRNRVTSLENKVDVMFQIVQEHANTANSGGGVGPPQGDLANDIGIPESVMNLQPEGANFENTQDSVNNVEQHNEVIDDDDDDSDNDDDDDSDDSDDYSENNDGETNLESTLKVVDMNETNDPNQLIQVSDDDDDDDDDDDEDSDDDDDDESDYENNNEGALPSPNLVISGSLMEPDMVNLEENDPGIVDVVDLPVDATIPDDSIKTLNIDEDNDEQSLAESDDSNLNKMQVSQLRDIAKEKGIKGVSKMKKKELISLLTQ